MTSLRQLFANRKNAARSTGPRTAQGKATSAKNALHHGLARSFVPTGAELTGIENLSKAISRELGGRVAVARTAAALELELVHIRKVRTEALGVVCKTIEEGRPDEIAAAIQMVEKIGRYERRVASRRKKALRASFDLDRL